jgi:hypothetical protein
VTVRDWFQLTLKEGLTVFRDQWFTGDGTPCDTIFFPSFFLLSYFLSLVCFLSFFFFLSFFLSFSLSPFFFSLSFSLSKP